MARGLGVLTANEAPGIGAHLASLGAVAALVRPDRYILGTAPDAAGVAVLIEAAPG